MASRTAVGRTLALFVEAFGGEVSPEKVAIYFDALNDLSDEQLGTAARAAIRTWTGAFMPPPAVLRNAVGANNTTAPLPDCTSIVARIQELGVYSPVGMRWPSIAAVRLALGDAIADAYSEAGAARLFADNETTRDIARREFAQALRNQDRRAAAAALASPSRSPAGLLGGGR